MKWKKIAVKILIVCIGVNLLAGCEKQKPEEKTKKTAMGRYIEEDVPMPDLVESREEIAYIMTEYKEGVPEIYAYNLKEESLYQYCMQEDGSWKRDQPQWLKEIKGEVTAVSYDTKGACYASVNPKNEESDRKSHASIIKSTSNQSAKQLFTDTYEDEWKSSAVLQIAVTQNDEVMLLHQNSADFYRDGKNVFSFELDGYQCVVTSNQLICSDLENDCIDFVNLDTGEIKQQIEFAHLRENGVVYGKDPSDNVYLVNNQGVYRIIKGGSTVEKIMEATMTSLNQPALNPEDICIDGQGSFYIMYQGEQGIRLMKHYRYDASVPSIPEKSITITSFRECESIRQTAASFEKEHPDVWVEIKVLCDEESKGMEQEALQQLNTELIAGNGPDIINLDELPIESYIEKGVMKDLTELLNPYLLEQKLLPNVINASKMEGKLYAVPARIGLCYAYGDAESVKHVDSLESLVEYGTSQKIPMFADGVIPKEMLIDFMYDNYAYEFCQGQKVDEEKLEQFLKQIKVLSDQIHTRDNIEDAPFRPIEIKMLESIHPEFVYSKEALLGFRTLSYVFDCIEPVYVTDYIKGSASIIHNQYVPKNRIGLNTASKQPELAAQFIQMMFSKEVQRYHSSDGYPINVDALEGYGLEEDDCSYSCDLYEAVQLNDRTPYQNILNFCRMADHPVVVNQTVKKSVMEGTLSYLKGEKDLADAMNQIMSHLKMYMKE